MVLDGLFNVLTGKRRSPQRKESAKGAPAKGRPPRPPRQPQKASSSTSTCSSSTPSAGVVATSTAETEASTPPPAILASLKRTPPRAVDTRPLRAQLALLEAQLAVLPREHVTPTKQQLHRRLLQQVVVQSPRSEGQQASASPLPDAGPDAPRSRLARLSQEPIPELPAAAAAPPPAEAPVEPHEQQPLPSARAARHAVRAFLTPRVVQAAAARVLRKTNQLGGTSSSEAEVEAQRFAPLALPPPAPGTRAASPPAEQQQAMSPLAGGARLPRTPAPGSSGGAAAASAAAPASSVVLDRVSKGEIPEDLLSLRESVSLRQLRASRSLRPGGRRAATEQHPPSRRGALASVEEEADATRASASASPASAQASPPPAKPAGDTGTVSPPLAGLAAQRSEGMKRLAEARKKKRRPAWNSDSLAGWEATDNDKNTAGKLPPLDSEGWTVKEKGAVITLPPLNSTRSPPALAALPAAATTKPSRPARATTPPGRAKLTQAEQRQMEAWKGMGGLEDMLRQPRPARPSPPSPIDVDQENLDSPSAGAAASGSKGPHKGSAFGSPTPLHESPSQRQSASRASGTESRRRTEPAVGSANAAEERVTTALSRLHSADDQPDAIQWRLPPSPSRAAAQQYRAAAEQPGSWAGLAPVPAAEQHANYPASWQPHKLLPQQSGSAFVVAGGQQQGWPVQTPGGAAYAYDQQPAHAAAVYQQQQAHAAAAYQQQQQAQAAAAYQQQQQRRYAPVFAPMPQQPAAYYSPPPMQQLQQHYQAAAQAYPYYHPGGGYTHLPQLAQQPQHAQQAAMPYFAQPLPVHAAAPGAGGSTYLPPLNGGLAGYEV